MEVQVLSSARQLGWREFAYLVLYHNPESPHMPSDLANTLGWQWVTGCGADAAPYFRILYPVIQAAKFDPHGGYMRRWVPELAAGASYLSPVVDHAQARERALAALASIKRA